MPINAQGLSISVFVLRDAKIQKYFIQIIYKKISLLAASLKINFTFG